MTEFGNAFDLSKLSEDESANTVSGWLVSGDEQTLRDYLKLSEQVPVLVLISDESEDSSAVRTLVTKTLEASEGRFAGIEISMSASPQLAQAVGVSMAPAMLAILSGQPAPLFQGAIAQEQFLQVLSQVLQLAKQNNITGRAKLAEAKEPESEPKKELSPEHQEAYAAIERGDLAGAKSTYQKILVEYPNDQDAEAGLAQVELMIRLQGGEKLNELETEMLGADQLLASNNPEGAFELLLSMFAERFEHRDAIKDRLLKLFLILGNEHPAVLEARRRLASLMF
jgi:putative thioredoxin